MVQRLKFTIAKYISVGCVLFASTSMYAADENRVVIPAGPSIWGTTGLIAIPSPALMEDGTIMVGANYLPGEFFRVSQDWIKRLGVRSSGSYCFNATFLPFWEVQLRFTLMKMIKEPFKNVWNQDRSFSTKFQILKEKGLYRPFIAIGMEDIAIKGWNANKYFTRVYASVAKHWDVKVGTLGTTANVVVARGKQVFPQVGVQFAPRAVRGLSAMAEYDGHGFNAGARWLLFNHVSLMAATYHFNSVTAGVAFYIDLY